MNDQKKLIILNYLAERVLNSMHEKAVWIGNLTDHVKELEAALKQAGIELPRTGKQNDASVNMDYFKNELFTDISLITDMSQLMDDAEESEHE